mmetsp:Transcript_38808/g.96429  ORF Transcript_38808/g.96429 Transcript_38808/m.96429 type:complete len:150 (-) Transcript_38808:43-492(-)
MQHPDAQTAQASSLAEHDQVTCDALCSRVRALLAAEDRSAFNALVPVVSNLLLDRAMQAVWAFSLEDLLGWSKQRMLALLVASISGGKLPTWGDAERPGQRMHEFLGRYRQRHLKLQKAEKAVIAYIFGYFITFDCTFLRESARISSGK